MQIQVHDVTVAYGGVPIVSKVTLAGKTGQITGLLGANGSGKSTLLKAVTRLHRPSTGQITLDGQDVWADFTPKRYAQSVAVLGQERGLEMSFSVADVISAGRIPHLGPLARLTSVDRDVVSTAAEQAGVLGFMDRRFNTLSGGEKQRVLLARAIAQDPAVLVLDEPTNHLDVRAQFELLDVVRRLEVTVLMAIHDLTLAAQYCDQVHILKSGELIASGTPTQACSTANIRRAFGVHSTQLVCPDSGLPLFSLRPITASPHIPNHLKGTDHEC